MLSGTPVAHVARTAARVKLLGVKRQNKSLLVSMDLCTSGSFSGLTRGDCSQLGCQLRAQDASTTTSP